MDQISSQGDKFDLILRGDKHFNSLLPIQLIALTRQPIDAIRRSGGEGRNLCLSRRPKAAPAKIAQLLLQKARITRGNTTRPGD